MNFAALLLVRDESLYSIIAAITAIYLVCAFAVVYFNLMLLAVFVIAVIVARIQNLGVTAIRERIFHDLFSSLPALDVMRHLARKQCTTI